MTTKDRFNAAMKMLSHSFEPLNCQLSKPWSTLSQSSKSYYLKKTQESIKLILNVIAPGQEYVLLDNLQQKEVSIDSTTRCIIDAFHNASNSRTQIQILSLIVNNFTKLELQKLIPGLSVAKIDGARKHSLVVGAGNLVNPPKIYRTKLTKPRVTHFIEFVMNPLYSTVIGFGQTMLKLSTNEKMEIPRVIRNVINARIISNYQNYCEENNFESYSRPTLYRILKVCAASKQKALQGLDNTTSGGMGAIDTLLKLVTKLETFGISHERLEKLKDSLRVINQFLKFEYKLHLKKLDGCTDHCTTYALSDPSISDFSSSCEHQHDANCDKCSLIDNVLDLITTELSKVQVNESVQDDIDFDLNSATKNLLEWKRHLLRTVHQDAARNDILKNLTFNQSLIIMDWAMKFLPVQFRETQSEFFGKKGLSWHISCSITRSESSEELDLNCYIHILENGTQGWFSIANILLHLLEQLKCNNQSLEEIYLKSDNAACYHCVNLLSFIQQNNSTFPIRIKEYNFSEAQSGKDLCDSKTGSSRLHIYRYANEGHNVLNAGDMKKALESYGGVKGTNICVVSIDQASEPKIKSKIPGISVFNNFAFTENGIVARKAYQVGSGQLIRASGISDKNLSKERVFNMEVPEPFTGSKTAGKVSNPTTLVIQHSANETSTIGENEPTSACDSQNVNFFCCPDLSCNKTFARATNLEKHILVGNHSYRTQKSGLDTAVEVYASMSESVQDNQINLIQTVSSATSSDTRSVMKNKGWALKGKRTNIRFSPKVKTYLNEICFNCEKTGKRPNYFALSDELRKTCKENGERMFKMEEWLNPTQIKSYFSSLVTKLKSGSTCISSNSITDNSAVVQSIELTEIEENVEQDEKLYEAVAIIEANAYNENIENFVDEVYTAVNM